MKIQQMFYENNSVSVLEKLRLKHAFHPKKVIDTRIIVLLKN